MMENQEPTNEAVEPTCAACLSVPISHLGLEEGIEVPLRGWSDLFDQMGIQILTDPAGRPAISALAARRLFAALKRRDELFIEDSQRRTAKLAAQRPVRAGGLPAQEGMSPFESLVAAGGVVSPSQEFSSGREKPRFLEEALAEGDRDLAEKTAAAKERLTERMRDKLGGKR